MTTRDRGDEMVVTCGCGVSFTHRGWLDLPEAGTLKNDGELMELRRCPCSRVVAVSRGPASTRG